MIKLSRYPLEVLMETNVTKAGLFKQLDNQKITFDYALPQQWLDNFVKETGLNYRLVLSTTVWCYHKSLFGFPISACLEVQKAIDNNK